MNSTISPERSQASLDTGEDSPRFTVAIIGGAAAGSEAARVLAQNGIVTVVFDMHPRPYGKIEDGLPRWHDKLRAAEYKKIDQSFAQERIHFVPNTHVGKDVSIDSLIDDWGFSAVLVATGAWRDRPLPIDGVDAYIGKGLLYQNAFISWYNHHVERGYDGTELDIPDGAIVVGGGLASIDVAKALQFEVISRAFRERGHRADPVEFETKGVLAACTVRGINWDELGIQGATLYYRRRPQDMPLADPGENPTEADIQKAERVREKLLSHAMNKYLFHFVPNRLPHSAIVDHNRLNGIVFSKTEMTDKGLMVLAETEHVVAPLVVSSIGSVPVLFPELPAENGAYAVTSQMTGEVIGHPNVFILGNAVTGKGNIHVSRRHGAMVASHLMKTHLGIDEFVLSETRGQTESVLETIMSRPERAHPTANLLNRVRDRQAKVGYGGQYQAWVEKMAPVEVTEE